jgi:hypothetical protein
MKYMNHKLSPPVIAINIQPVWLIDEYVRIFRSDVWFIPPVDLTRTDVRTIDSVGSLNFNKYDVKIIGAIFCAPSSKFQKARSRSIHAA